MEFIAQQMFGGNKSMLFARKKKSEIKEQHCRCNIYIVPEENERCVIGGKKTGMNRRMPIHNRKYYVECCGQLCEECFISLNLGKNLK